MYWYVVTAVKMSAFQMYEYSDLLQVIITSIPMPNKRRVSNTSDFPRLDSQEEYSLDSKNADEALGGIFHGDRRSHHTMYHTQQKVPAFPGNVSVVLRW
jgi:hypothetical protein